MAQSDDVQKPFDPVPVGLVVGTIVLVALVWSLWPRPLTPENVWGQEERLARAENSKNTAEETKVKELPIALIETTLGTIKVELFTDKAPITAKNFIDLVEKEFYDGIVFHRVISDFMIQTGDPTGTGRGGRTDKKGFPRKKLPDEFHPDLRHDSEGILSMANSGPNTGDTQFFITCIATPWLDDKHAVFGKVIEGMDVVHKIENVKKGPGDRPVKTVKMIKVRMVKKTAENDE